MTLLETLTLAFAYHGDKPQVAHAKALSFMESNEPNPITMRATVNPDPLLELNEIRYGDDKTIHGSTEVNVETDGQGKVVAVWYRCRTLPFTQSDVDENRAKSMKNAYKEYPNTKIKAIVFEKEAK